MSCAPPVFVVGPPRCGTTLVASMLGRHSNVLMPPETHFFEDVYSRRSRVKEPFDEDARRAVVDRLATLYGRYKYRHIQPRIDELLSKEDVRRAFDEVRTYRDALSAFMETQMRADGKQRWGNHTPRDIFAVDEILSFYPDAAFICCVRDARDFLSSYKRKWRTIPEESSRRLKALYHPLITTLLWRSSVRSVARLTELVRPENRVVIRYEDLVADPARAVRSFCECLGEEYEPAMLEVRAYSSSYGTKANGVFGTSVGKWRTELSSEEICVAQWLARSEMERFGYALERRTVSRGKLLGLHASAPVALARALWINRAYRGPLLPYLWSRMGLKERLGIRSGAKADDG